MSSLWNKIKHFNPDVDKMLACPCCGVLNVNEKSIMMLDEARHIAGIPFHITSACRCIDYNAEVGGVDSSAHTASARKECFAFDISAEESRQRHLTLTSLRKAGFTRIGIANTFIHCDFDFSKTSNVTWVY